MLKLRKCSHKDLEKYYSLFEVDFDSEELLPKLSIHRAMLKGEQELKRAGWMLPVLWYAQKAFTDMYCLSIFPFSHGTEIEALELRPCALLTNAMLISRES